MTPNPSVKQKPMSRRIVVAASVLAALSVVSGCATYKPIPDGYSGDRTIIKDSVLVHSSSKADFFFVEAVDNHNIENSRIRTRLANQGRGMNMSPVVVEREIPTRPTTLRLVGRTEYGAPILALTSAVYQVKGDVQFTPEPHKSYVVKGDLGENYSAVWLEEIGTNAIVGAKVEVNGSAKLGILEK